MPVDVYAIKYKDECVILEINETIVNKVLKELKILADEFDSLYDAAVELEKQGLCSVYESFVIFYDLENIQK